MKQSEQTLLEQLRITEFEIEQRKSRIPDDYLSKRLWKLTLAREGLGKLLETLKARTT
jgi:hypothetical protein